MVKIRLDLQIVKVEFGCTLRFLFFIFYIFHFISFISLKFESGFTATGYGAGRSFLCLVLLYNINPVPGSITAGDIQLSCVMIHNILLSGPHNQLVGNLISDPLLRM